MATFDPTRQLMSPYDSQIAQATQKQRLAELLMKQGVESMNGPPGQMVGKHFVPNSPLKYIASGLMAFGGLKAGENATKNVAEQAKLRQGEVSRQVADVMGRTQNLPVRAGDEGPMPAQKADYMGAASTAMQSPYPEVQSLAKLMTELHGKERERQGKLFDAAARAGSQTSVVKAAQNDGNINDIAPFVPEQPIVKRTPDGAEYIQTGKPDGSIGVNTVSRPPVIRNDINMGDNAKDVAGFNHTLKAIETGREKAESQLKTLTSNIQILADLDKGVKTGAANYWQQPLRQVFSAMGFEGDKASLRNVDALRNELRKRIMTNAGGSFGASISNTDRDFIRDMSGTDLMDPNVLRRVLAIDAGMQMQMIDKYNKQFDNAAHREPHQKDYWESQKIRFTVPVSKDNDPLIKAAVRGEPLPLASSLTPGDIPGGVPSTPGNGARPAPGKERRRVRMGDDGSLIR